MTRRRLSYTVKTEDEGKPVLALLRQGLSLSSSSVKRAKRLEDGILLDGEPVFTNAAVRPGQVLTVRLSGEERSAPHIARTPGELSILYEDRDLLVVDKPADLCVHPSQGHRDSSLAGIVLWHYERWGEPMVFRPVNRLDRHTSGLMVVAKNAHAQAQLARQHTQGSFFRTYLALANGRVSPGEGRIDAPIARAPGSILARQVDPAGAPAATRYTVLDASNEVSLVCVRPETGRTHQIRVHFASLGHPLLGDFLYGQEQPDLIGRTALHSWRLSFLQPVSGAPIHLEAPLPQDMARCIQQLGLKLGTQ